MFNYLSKQVNQREFELLYNDRKLNITSRRIKGLKNFKDSLISPSEIGLDKSYFIYNEPNIATYGLKISLDIIWVDWDGKIIHMEQSFQPNKISKEINNTKFIYIFEAGIIDRKKLIMNDLLTHVYDRKKNKNNSII